MMSQVLHPSVRSTFFLLMIRSHGREKLQLVCLFNSFSFTAHWVGFSRKHLTQCRERNFNRPLMAKCCIYHQGEVLSSGNPCTHIRVYPDGDLGRTVGDQLSTVRTKSRWCCAETGTQSATHGASSLIFLFRAFRFPMSSCLKAEHNSMCHRQLLL